MDLFLSSPKVRARETAELVAEAIGAEVRLDERLAGGLSLAEVERILADAGDPDSAVLVGHDPDFSELAADLTGAARLELKKGAICRLDVERPLREGDAVLRWLVPPSLLRGSGKKGR